MHTYNTYVRTCTYVRTYMIGFEMHTYNTYVHVHMYIHDRFRNMKMKYMHIRRVSCRKLGKGGNNTYEINGRQRGEQDSVHSRGHD